MDRRRCAGQIYETAAELKRGSQALLQCCGPSVWCYCLLRQHFTLTSKLHDPSHSSAMQPQAMEKHIQIIFIASINKKSKQNNIKHIIIIVIIITSILKNKRVNVLWEQYNHLLCLTLIN